MKEKNEIDENLFIKAQLKEVSTLHNLVINDIISKTKMKRITYFSKNSGKGRFLHLECKEIADILSEHYSRLQKNLEPYKNSNLC